MDCKGLLRLNYDAIQITKQESFGLLVQSEDTLQRGLKGEKRLRRVCILYQKERPQRGLNGGKGSPAGGRSLCERQERCVPPIRRPPTVGLLLGHLYGDRLLLVGLHCTWWHMPGVVGYSLAVS